MFRNSLTPAQKVRKKAGVFVFANISAMLKAPQSFNLLNHRLAISASVANLQHKHDPERHF